MSSWWRELNPGELAYLRRTSVDEAKAFIAAHGPVKLKRNHPRYAVYAWPNPNRHLGRKWLDWKARPLTGYRGIRGMREWRKVHGDD